MMTVMIMTTHDHSDDGVATVPPMSTSAVDDYGAARRPRAHEET
jgi:hypothetical protein